MKFFEEISLINSLLCELKSFLPKYTLGISDSLKRDQLKNLIVEFSSMLFS